MMSSQNSEINIDTSLSFNPSFSDSDKNIKPTIENNSNVISKISLSTRSKTFLILRIFMFAILCIFFPLETILYRKLEVIENKIILSKISSFFSDSLSNNNLIYYFTLFSREVLGGKEAIIVYTGIIYMLFHPFIALKLVYITNIAYFIIVVLQCLYQSRRPFWTNANESIVFCPTSYAFPSGTYFLISFFFLYTTISLRLVEKKKSLGLCKRVIIFFVYFVLIIFSAFILVINKLCYIYQIVFTFTLSLVMICLLIDLDTVIHNFILKSLKNVFKTRKYKMKIFFYVLAMSVISTIIYCYVPIDDLNVIEDNLSQSLGVNKCSFSDIEQLGVKKTFTDISYIFGIIGAFWGASNTVENEVGVWWEASCLNLSLKIFTTLLVNILYFYVSSFISHPTFELNFLLSSLKYWAHYYIIMGILPVIFEKMNMNGSNNKPKEKITDKYKKQNSQLFSKTIFSQKFNKNDLKWLNGDDNNKYNPLLVEDDNASLHLQISDKEDKKKEEKGSIYKKSVLIGGLSKHRTSGNLEFVNDKENEEEDSKYEDNYFNGDLSLSGEEEK